MSAIFPGRPVQFPGKRTEKSPSRMVCRLARMTLRSPESEGGWASAALPLLLLFAASSPPLLPLRVSAGGASVTTVAVVCVFRFIRISCNRGVPADAVFLPSRGFAKIQLRTRLDPRLV